MKDPSGRRDQRHTNPQGEARGRGADLDHSLTFKREMERMDGNMHRIPPRASQRMEMRAQAAACRLEFELANLNAPVVHEIGESSLAAIMEISDSE
jgi:predicted ATPase